MSNSTQFSGEATKWVTGTTYVQGQIVWSPADYQAYRRKTNGAGTLDPAYDPVNYATTYRVAKTLSRNCSATTFMGTLNSSAGALSYAIPTHTAGALQTILSITNGRGQLNWLGASSPDPTLRTLRVKITVDGSVILDATSAGIAASGFGAVWIGTGFTDVSIAPTVAAPTFQPILYNSSLLIEATTNLAETSGSVSINYEIH